MEVDWGQDCLPRIANIDWRLVMPNFTLGKFRTEITPMTRSMGVAIIPIVIGMLFLRGTNHGQGKREADNSSEARLLHLWFHATMRQRRPLEYLRRVAEPRLAEDCKS